MTAAHTRARPTACGYVACALVLTACLLAAACSGEQPGATSQDNVSGLRCNENEARVCPCLGSTVLGSQLCNAQGNGFAPCTGCPSPEPAGAGDGALGGGGGGGIGMTGAAGSAGAMGGAGGATDAGVGDSGAADAMFFDATIDASEPEPAGDVEPGTSCGVGLVTQCQLGTQKCCVRSLATDTCIADADACTCELPNCAVMEAHCDGPEDCGDGQYCCGTLSSSLAGYDDFTCTSQCDYHGQQRAACHQQASQCPPGLVCANSQLLTNVQVCIDPATIQQ